MAKNKIRKMSFIEKGNIDLSAVFKNLKLEKYNIITKETLKKLGAINGGKN